MSLFVFFCKINRAPFPKDVKNPISNFGSCKLTLKTPICQILCMNSQKSLAKKVLKIYIFRKCTRFFSMNFYTPAILLDRLSCATHRIHVEVCSFCLFVFGNATYEKEDIL